jgi:hypothetical protein
MVRGRGRNRARIHPGTPGMRYARGVTTPAQALDRGSCRRGGCGRPTAYVCAYVDRRGRECRTGWCPQHSVQVGRVPYCPRHASTVIAIGAEALQRGHLPELDNRVPSLVYWVGRDLDQDVPTILAGLVNSRAGESLVVDPVALVTGGGRTSARRWERNWKVVSHTGIAERVTLQVLEDEPTELVVRVGQKIVAHEVPPWIAERAAGGAPDGVGDDGLRRTFYVRLHNAISSALGARASR